MGATPPVPRPRLFHQRGGTLFVNWVATVALPPSKSSRLFRDVPSGNPDLLVGRRLLSRLWSEIQRRFYRYDDHSARSETR